ncbi:DTW domain-containing protein [Permianibacter sp. IMCC34836]|uniref:tRNA-uridine aminocarboxypropyltransferase n=1 Tax=Permianibacter fluminis TaxID=2738515 RepID=UPI001555039B|nr:tRNA-uridine aminocarboxypropyltransferase [Permianibacter fluminis]NQD37587.1 DTW domain-containing protein [Permianibacter fluminis]
MDTCPTCYKIRPLCVCDLVEPHDNRVHVLILQHPQEPDKELGSARLANLILKKSTLKTALSIANLRKAVGEDANPNEWIVLFLGSKYKFRELARIEDESDLYVFDRKGEIADVEADEIKGIIAIDGTWAQAKTLWWRNPWLLKVRRAVLNPRALSKYGNLRKEPRKECLSTIESIAYTLEVLGEDKATTDALLHGFEGLLGKYRAHRKAQRQVAKQARTLPSSEEPSDE